jgi:hypothetical protein
MFEFALSKSSKVLVTGKPKWIKVIIFSTKDSRQCWWTS